MRHEMHDLHGTGAVDCEVYDMTPTPENPWAAVTGVPCPVRGCHQTMVWYEAGYVPGYRVCMRAIDAEHYDQRSLRHRFLAGPDLTRPMLIRDAEAENRTMAARVLGRKGGRTVGRGTGAAKVRGDSDHYRALRARRTTPPHPYGACEHCGVDGLAWARLQNARWGQIGAYPKLWAWVLCISERDAHGLVVTEGGHARPKQDGSGAPVLHACPAYLAWRAWMLGEVSTRPAGPRPLWT